jgi:hypothetical protein
MAIEIESFDFSRVQLFEGPNFVRCPAFVGAEFFSTMRVEGAADVSTQSPDKPEVFGKRTAWRARAAVSSADREARA